MAASSPSQWDVRSRAAAAKIGFWAKDIGAAREALVKRGARMTKLMVGAGLVRCEGKYPDGIPFSISDRA